MPVLSSAALLRLVLLAAPPEASAPSAPPACETGTRHLELTVDTPGEAHEVCMTGRERFRVIAGEAGLTLVLTQGEHVPVTVTFQGGVAPAGASFTLVVHPSEAERRVEVTRQPRTLASSREGEQQARADAQQCGAEKARLEAECSGQVGLLGLLAQELLGEGGIDSKDISRSVTSRMGNTLQSMKALSYRAVTGRVDGGRKVVRLAVRQALRNNGSTSWTPGGAVLVGPNSVEWKALGGRSRSSAGRPLQFNTREGPRLPGEQADPAHTGRRGGGLTPGPTGSHVPTVARGRPRGHNRARR